MFHVVARPTARGPQTTTYGTVSSVAAQLLAAATLTTSVLLPVTFLPVQEDAFALPKTVMLLSWATVSAVCLGLTLATVSSGRWLPRPIAVLLLAYIALSATAMALSANPARSIFGEHLQYQGFAATLAYALAFCVGTLCFRSYADVRLLLWTISVTAAVVAVYAIVQMLGLDPFDWSFGTGAPERAFSSIGQANALASYLVIAIPLAISLIPGAGKSGRLALLGIVALECVALAVTFSRSAYIALPVVLFVVTLPLARLCLRRQTLLAVLAAGAVVAVALAAIQPLNETTQRVVQRAGSVTELKDASIEKREGMWLVATEITLQNPLFGTGQETYPEQFSEYRDDNLPGFGAAPARPESPHNNYLAIASSTGITALVVYLALIACCFRLLLRPGAGAPSRVLLYGIAAALVAHLVTDFTNTAETTGSWLFWLLVGAGIGLAMAAGREVSERIQSSDASGAAKEV